MNTEPIQGGFVLVARKMSKSGIMEKPPLYLKLWVWMLMQASYKDHGDLKRGQFFTSLDRMRSAMAYKVGARIEKPTIKQIRCALDFLSKGRAVVTTKVTHGLLITICNYDYYQKPGNYEGHGEGHGERNRRGTILTRRENKNGYKEEKKKKPPISPRGICVPNWINTETWNDFLEHRKKLKPAMSLRAQELMIKKLESLKTEGYNPNDLLNQSIMNGWKGVFRPKEDVNDRARTSGGKRKVVEKARNAETTSDGRSFPVDHIITPDNPEDSRGH